MVELLQQLWQRAGYPFAQDDAALTRIRLDWEWRSGQWALIAGPDNKLWGWQSWYRMGDAVLALVRSADADAMHSYVLSGTARDLVGGPHCFIPTTIVAPWAPPGTYRRLFEATCSANRDATTISSWLVKRDGRRRWMERPMSEEVHRCQGHLQKTNRPQ